MSADIEKLAVFDSRIVQSRPKYAVEKGALSLTNAPFNAIAASASQHTYNIYVPSENVYVDRAVEWSSTAYLTFKVQLNQTPILGQSLAVLGRDWSLCAFPLNSLCSTMTATINDTTTVINSQDVLTEVLRLTDYKKNRLQRTCPTKLDRYSYYADGNGSINTPIAGYESQTDFAESGNGAFAGVYYTDPQGNPLGTASPAFPGATYDALNGVPVVNSTTLTNVSTPIVPTPVQPENAPPFVPVATYAYAPQQIYIAFRSTEKLVLSPFVFSDCHEWDTGLFGINNIQLIMNLQSPARLIRNNPANGVEVVAGSIAFNTSSTQGVFNQSVVNCQFLTPSLDVPLPPKSVVPYMEFPRYITQYQNGTIAPGATQQLQSQTITLPQIPDLFIIYAKAPSYGAFEGDWRFPVATRLDGVANPLSVNFDNFSGLLSSVTAEQLYAMSVKNGVDMDWNTWIGEAKSQSVAPLDHPGVDGSAIPLVGGPLVLKPSQDITLQTGQAPSLVGNFTFQFNLTVKNTSDTAVAPQLYVITVNSGFFESIRGSSRIIKGVLSEQDIISAPLAPMGTRDQMSRYVGSGGMFSSLANILSKAKDIYHATKPAISAVKGCLPDSGVLGKVKGAMGSVGYGMSGGDASGGASGGRRRGMEARLM